MLARTLPYAVPLALFAPDALAWGLQTHLFLAQAALALMPFADPSLRSAVARLPHLLLAGACLPDLFLAGRILGTPAFVRAHRWSTLRRIAAAPRSDEERVLAAGYASHLVSDVVAHNFFVPEHEARLVNVPHATHALAEWAMDRYLGNRMEVKALLSLCAVAPFVARAFHCDAAIARRALGTLSAADGWLRASPIPWLCRKLVDTAPFDAWMTRATATLHGIETALTGARVDWVDLDPEGGGGDEAAQGRARQHVARVVQPQHDA
ncbi:MAG TPA: zinc dependent phospholipase C family protein [Burkholderiales bacterium]|nr:zinc dependent phospholipase C family protein [Burkholderiales bacterium]